MLRFIPKRLGKLQKVPHEISEPCNIDLFQGAMIIFGELGEAARSPIFLMSICILM